MKLFSNFSQVSTKLNVVYPPLSIRIETTGPVSTAFHRNSKITTMMQTGQRFQLNCIAEVKLSPVYYQFSEFTSHIYSLLRGWASKRVRYCIFLTHKASNTGKIGQYDSIRLCEILVPFD